MKTNKKTLLTYWGVLVDNMKIQSTHLATLLTYLGRQSTNKKTLLTYWEAMYRQIKINHLHLQFSILGLTNNYQHCSTLSRQKPKTSLAKELQVQNFNYGILINFITSNSSSL